MMTTGIFILFGRFVDRLRSGSFPSLSLLLSLRLDPRIAVLAGFKPGWISPNLNYYQTPTFNSIEHAFIVSMLEVIRLFTS